MARNGKGSLGRPFSVDETTFAQRWEMAFGKGAEAEPQADVLRDEQPVGETPAPATAPSTAPAPGPKSAKTPRR